MNRAPLTTLCADLARSHAQAQRLHGFARRGLGAEQQADLADCLAQHQREAWRIGARLSALRAANDHGFVIAQEAG